MFYGKLKRSTARAETSQDTITEVVASRRPRLGGCHDDCDLAKHFYQGPGIYPKEATMKAINGVT
jgi:hypothetical protein